MAAGVRVGIRGGGKVIVGTSRGEEGVQMALLVWGRRDEESKRGPLGGEAIAAILEEIP